MAGTVSTLPGLFALPHVTTTPSTAVYQLHVIHHVAQIYDADLFKSCSLLRLICTILLHYVTSHFLKKIHYK